MLFSFISAAADIVFPNTTISTTAMTTRTYLHTCYFSRNGRMDQWRPLVTKGAEQETIEKWHDCKSCKFAIRRSLNIPPLLKSVTTLLCETLFFKNWSFNFIIADIIIVTKFNESPIILCVWHGFCVKASVCISDVIKWVSVWVRD